MVVHPSSHGDSSCPAVLWIQLASLRFTYRTLTLYGWPSQTILFTLRLHVTVRNPMNIATHGLASSAFARHYSRNLGWLLFLRLLRCFSSAGSLRIPMDSVYGLICCHMRGFPIRISADISAICASPRLFAACHVLLRLPMPRHSPCALSSLNFFEWSLNVLYINLIFCSCMSFANRCILSYAFLSLNCICFTLILGKTFFISWLDLKKFLSV